MIAFKLLEEPLISVRSRGELVARWLTLPKLYAELAEDRIWDFPALRPHQRHVWHAFLTQVATLALHGAGRNEFPGDVDTWRDLLLSLTPDDPDGAAWSLVSPADRPALLQAPVPGGSTDEFKAVTTPDELDMLVTGRNHDVKGSVIRTPAPELWLYALLSLQTQSGVLGAPNKGISRMNGGYASRSGVGLVVSGAWGARVQRDVRRLLALRSQLLEDYTFYRNRGGVALVWLVPWSGDEPLSMQQLDPYYIEICRQIRLRTDARGIVTGLKSGTTKRRIAAAELKGNTGDPWTPLVGDGEGFSALTVKAPAFRYDKVVDVLFGNGPKAVRRAPLQVLAPDDPDTGVAVLCRAIVGGQGETEGFHERSVPVTSARRWFGTTVVSDPAAECARQRVADVSLFAKKVLWPAMMALYTGAPASNERTRDDDVTKERARRAGEAFEGRVDQGFFEALDRELQVLGDPTQAGHVRARWLLNLKAIGQVVLEHELAAGPRSALRHLRVQVAARARFHSAFRKHFGSRPGVQPDPMDGEEV